MNNEFKKLTDVDTVLEESKEIIKESKIHDVVCIQDLCTYDELKAATQELYDTELIDDDQYDDIMDFIYTRDEEVANYIEERAEVTNTDERDIAGIIEDNVKADVARIVSFVESGEALEESKEIKTESSDKDLETMKKELRDKKRQALLDAGDTNTGDLTHLNTRLPEEVYAEIRKEEEIIRTIDMIHSILTYADHWDLDTVMSNRYIQSHIQALGRGKVQELAEQEIDYFEKHAKIARDVFTDGEGTSYNSVKFEDCNKDVKNESKITDYICDRDLDRALRNNKVIKDVINSYIALDDMVLQIRTDMGVSYYKAVVNDDNKIELYLISKEGEKLGDSFLLEEAKTFDTMDFAQNLPMSYINYVDENLKEYIEELGHKDLTTSEIECFIVDYKNDLSEEDLEDFQDKLAIDYIEYKMVEIVKGKVEEDIESEPVEEDVFEETESEEVVEVAKTTIDALVASKEAIIAGYDAFLSQIKETLSEGMFEVLEKEIAELKASDETDIETLIKLKDAFHLDTPAQE